MSKSIKIFANEFNRIVTKKENFFVLREEDDITFKEDPLINVGDSIILEEEHNGRDTGRRCLVKIMHVYKIEETELCLSSCMYGIEIEQVYDLTDKKEEEIDKVKHKREKMTQEPSFINEVEEYLGSKNIRYDKYTGTNGVIIFEINTRRVCDIKITCTLDNIVQIQTEMSLFGEPKKLWYIVDDMLSIAEKTRIKHIVSECYGDR